MLTSTGFIQVLLMLTQSWFMPDLSMLFEPKPPVAEVVSVFKIKPAIQHTTSAAYRNSIEAIRRRDKQLKHAPLPVTARMPHKISLLKPVQKKHATVIHKKYLVFCQLKADG